MRHFVLAAMPALLIAAAAQAASFTETKLTPIDVAKKDRFGISVAISGPTAIVGARRIGDNQGPAYLFDTTTGKQTAKLTIKEGTKNDDFGLTVAISGPTAIVGASAGDNDDKQGAAYLFDTTTGKQTAKFPHTDTLNGGGFVTAIAISGAAAIIGIVEFEGGGGTYILHRQ